MGGEDIFKMTIMDIIRKFGKKKEVMKGRMAEVAIERRIQKTLDDREMSANERELIRHNNEVREANIKAQLERIRMQKTKEQWCGNNFAGRATILQEDNPILKQKNIFKGNKNIFKEKGMFFK